MLPLDLHAAILNLVGCDESPGRVGDMAGGLGGGMPSAARLGATPSKTSPNFGSLQPPFDGAGRAPGVATTSPE
jgi:hypothetical protein